MDWLLYDNGLRHERINGTITLTFVPWYIKVVCSAYKTWSIAKETPAEHLPLQKQSFADIYKKGLLKNFLKLTEKHLYRSLYLKNLYASNLQFYLTRDTDTDVFLQILRDI